MAEKQFSRDLRVRQMQATDSGTVVGGLIQMTSDCRDVQGVRVYYSGRYREIPPLTPAALAETYTTSVPIGYVVVGQALQLINGTDGAAYQVTYWQDIPALATAPMNRNWLIQREPALYLYGSLIQAAPYLQESAMLDVWVKQYQTILAGMQIEDDNARYGSGAAMRIRTP